MTRQRSKSSPPRRNKRRPSPAKLKEEVATLQKELAEIASTQSEMDSLRAEEKATYEETKPELEKAVAGIQKALKVLKDYYAKAATHGASEGAGSGIIGLLEVAEADFSKNLSEVLAEALVWILYPT